jgi:cation transport ATPase
VLDGDSDVRMDYATAHLRVGYDPRATDVAKLTRAIEGRGYVVGSTEKGATPVSPLWRRSRHEISTAISGGAIAHAPALESADIGIAMGAAGSDTALETADVALMSDDPTALPAFFDLG